MVFQYTFTFEILRVCERTYPPYPRSFRLLIHVPCNGDTRFKVWYVQKCGKRQIWSFMMLHGSRVSTECEHWLVLSYLLYLSYGHHDNSYRAWYYGTMAPHDLYHWLSLHTGVKAQVKVFRERVFVSGRWVNWIFHCLHVVINIIMYTLYH
jgi:hypothetical protein